MTINILLSLFFLFRNNLVLSHIIQRWHPTEWKARALTHEATELMEKKKYDEAVSKLTEALRLSKLSLVTILSLI